jgi:hypothetical protein
VAVGRVLLSYFDQSILLSDGEHILGRDATCDLRLIDPGVSRRHARIRVAGGGATIEELGSRHGTLLNGQRLQGSALLHHGDALVLGNCPMIVRFEEGEFDEPTADVTPIRAHGSIAPPSSAPTGPVTGRDRRRAERYRIEVPILYESEHLTVETVSRDLSANGVFVRTSILDEVSTDCRLVIQGDRGSKVTLTGRVRRVVDSSDRGEPLGLGIEFLEIDAAARDWLARTIRQSA